jgi:uncharacterized delta-60 repeat protein
VDEGTSPSDSDFVNTGTSGTGGEIEEYSLDSPPAVASATQVVITARLRSITVGSTADTVDIAMRINGTLQAVTTVTMTTTITNYTVTYNGTWSQSDVDSMQIYLIRNVVGTGPGGSRDDDVAVYNTYATLTYTASQTFEQAAYRWYDNQDASGVTTYAFAHGTNSSDTGSSLSPTTDGGYIGSATSGGEAILTKYSSAGSVVWTQSWGGAGNDIGRDAIQTSDGGYVLTGNTLSFGISGSMFIAKYTSAGSLVWDAYWGGSSSDAGYAVVQTSDGGYAVAGTTSSFGTGGDIFVAKYNSTGSLLWDMTWGGAATDDAHDIIETNDGGLAVVGNSSSFTASQDVVLIKLTSTGSISWDATWGGSSVDYGNSLVESSDNGIVITGGWGNSFSDFFIAKFTSSGTLSWDQTWGGGSSDIANAITTASDGGFVITGYTGSFGAGGQDTAIAKFTSSGTLSWDQTWGGTGSDPGNGIASSPDGGFAVIGSTTSLGPTNDNITLLKFGTTGTISGCSSPTCQDPSASTADPSASTSDPSVTAADPSATASDPGATQGSITLTKAISVAVSPTIDVGSARAALNTAATAPAEGTIFRLRLAMHVGATQLDPGAVYFKLRYALKGGAGSCSAVSSGTFLDVRTTTPVSYADNANAGSGQSLATNANDPTHSSDTLVRQSYLDNDTSSFTAETAISAGQDGIWDFGLKTYHAVQGDTYCLKLVKSDGSNLNTLTQFPEITIPSTTFDQAHYRWYDAETGGGSSFAKAYGSTGDDRINDLAKTSDGGYVSVGSTTDSASAGSTDALISKYSSSGDLQWSEIWGGSQGESWYKVVQTSDGGYAVAGTTNTNAFTTGVNGANDMVLAKYDSAGGLTWNKNLGTSGTDTASSLIQSSDGGYVMTGADGTSNEVLVIKLDSSGAISWKTLWGSGTVDVDQANDVVEASDGGFVFTGYSLGFGYTTSRMILVKLNSSGTLVWDTSWGGAGSHKGQALVRTSDNGYAVTGKTQLGPGGTAADDMFVAKFDSSGNLSWDRTWGNNFGVTFSTESGEGIVQTSDGGYAVTGAGNSFFNDGSDVFLVKLNSSGSISWDRVFGDRDDAALETAWAVAQTSDGGYIVGASTNTAVGQGSYDNLLVKYDSSGDISGCPNITLCTDESVPDSDPSATVESPAATTNYSPTVSSGNPSATTNTITSFVTTEIVAFAQSIGAPITDQNVPLDFVSHGKPVTLKIAIAMGNSGLGTAPGSGQSYELQFATLGGNSSCAAVSTGDYVDVTENTALRYYDDPRYTDHTGISASPDDPIDPGRTMKPQEYIDVNQFSNFQFSNTSSIYADEDGLWQFMLTVDSSAYRGATYCIRVAEAGVGAPLISASEIAELKVRPDMSRLLRGGNSFDLQGRKNKIAL